MADPFLDTLGISVPDAAPTSAKAPTYDPTDLAVRLAMLEDSDPAGRQAVAGVMANRAAAAKGDLLGALTAPKAFEPWASKQKELAAIDPNSDDYKATAAAILPILQGKAPNPVGTAVNFYSPESQVALAGDGRQAKPGFDDGKGVRIGGNLFFGTGQAAAGAAPGDDFAGTLGIDPGKAAESMRGMDADLAAGPATIKLVNGQVVDGATGKPVPKAQVDALHALVASGRLGSDGMIDGHPVIMQRDASDAVAPGSFYIEAGTGKLKGGPQQSSLGAGVMQGIGDVGHTALNLVSHLPGAQDSTLKNIADADTQIYDATHSDLKSGIGRFVGQVGASGPLLAGGEALASPLLSRAGQVGEFLAGQGGMDMAAGVPRLLTRAASVGAREAGAGAGAAALTSSASDKPLGEQLAEGAAGGAFLGPLVHGGFNLGKGAVNGVRALIEPHTAAGPANIAERRIAEILAMGPHQAPDLTVHVPGSSPTLAEATGSAPLAQMQRNLSQNPLVSGVFEAADQANNGARQAVTNDAQGDLATVADLARARATAVDAHKAAVFSGAGPADTAPVVAHIDEALKTPEALHPEVAPALQKARDALVTEPAKDLTPEESAAFNRQVAATFGGTGDALTPEVMDAARKTLGAKFDEIAGKTSMAWDDKLRSDIADTLHNVAQVVPESSLPPLFKQMDNIASTANDGKSISGASYQALTKKGAPLSALQQAADPSIRDAANQIREHLDDALERSVAASAPKTYTADELHAMDTDDLDKMAFGVTDGQEMRLKPDQIELDPKRNDIENPEDAFRKGGMKWADSVDLSDPVHVRVGDDGKYVLEDGHHRWFAAQKRGVDLPVVIEVTGNPTRAILARQEAGAADVGPSPIDELRGARLQYKNLKTAEAALRSAGPDGVVSPRAVYSAVKQNFGNYAYKGGGPLGDVAEAAVTAQGAKTPTLESDPAKLFALRENLTAKIDKLTKAGETDDASRAAAQRLSATREQMDAALDKAAPGYADFRRIADSSAEPIEAQRYLQSLPLTTNGARGGTVTLNLVNKALERIDKARSLPGPHPAKSITPHTLTQLRSLQADLEREANRNLGKAKGSETNQLGSAQMEFGAMGAPLLVAQHVAGKVPLVGPHVANAVGRATQSANERVMGALASRLLNPEPLAIPTPGPGSRVAQTGRRVLATLPAAAGGVLGSRLLGGH